jgi:hypothetical protein
MFFNIVKFLDLTEKEKKYLFETHLYYQKLRSIRFNFQQDPYDVNYNIIQLMNNTNKNLFLIEKFFISQINNVLIKKLFFNFSNYDVHKKVLNNVFYDDISNIILDFSFSGNKLIFIKLHEYKSFIILKNIKILKNLLRNDFISKIYIEKYPLHNGLTLKDLSKFKPVYDFKNLSFSPTNINEISPKFGIYNIILIRINYFYYYFGIKKNKIVDFFIHSIEQLELIEFFFNKNKKFIFCNFSLYSIKSIGKDLNHKIYLNLDQIKKDIFTFEIYNFLLSILINKKKL